MDDASHLKMNQSDYFSAYSSLKLTRDEQGILVVEFHTNGGPLTFTAQDHTEFVDVFYRISQDRANKVVILTGAHGHGDHWFGIGALLECFPNAKAVATPNVVKVMRQHVSPELLEKVWKASFPGQIPDRIVIAEELKGNVIDLEGHTWLQWNLVIPTPTVQRV
jgi:hypothetical protein